MGYVRANLEDSARVSRALSAGMVAGGILPGQGTQWRNGSDRLLMRGNNTRYVSGRRSQPLQISRGAVHCARFMKEERR